MREPSAGWPRPASRARSTTPPSCSPTCSARPAAGCPGRRGRRPSGRRRFEDAGRPARRARAAAAPDRDRAAFRHVELAGRTGGVRAPAGDRAARRLGDRAGAAVGRGAVVVDLCTRVRRDRREHRRRGPGAARARRRAGPGSARLGRAQPRRRRGVDLRLGDMADAFPDLDGTVDVVVCNPPYIPLEAWESVAAEARDHDPPWRCGPGRTGSTPSGCWSRPPRGCCGPVAGSGSSTPTCRVSRRRRCSSRAGRWADVRDHRGPGRSCALPDGATGMMTVGTVGPR